MREGAADRAMHLRHATETVSVLDARIVLEMRLSNFTPFQERQKMFGDRFLTGVRPGVLQTQIEGGRSALERLKAHRAGNIGQATEPLGAENREPTNCVHGLRAVEQSESLFCFEMLGLKPGATKCFAAFHSFTLKKRLAFADQTQGEMSERGEIATGADRSFFWNDRIEAAVEHFTEHLDDSRTDSAQSQGQHIRAEQHHRAHFRFRKWRADATRMTADKVELKLAQFAMRNAHIRQLPESSGHAVNDRVARDDVLDDFS